MAYNPFYQNPYASVYSNPYGYQSQMPQQQYQAPTSPPQQIKSNMQFMTEEEIKAYVLLPNTEIYAIDREKSKLYVKMADQTGKSYLYTYVIKNENGTDITEPAKTDDYVRKEELEAFATKQDIDEIRKIIEQMKEQEVSSK